MASPQHWQKAIEANKNGKIGVNWGMHGVLPKGWAKKQGWPNPFWSYKFKRVFISKMLESQENFKKALVESGIDLYLSE